MKKIYLLILLMATCSQLQAQTLVWAKQFSGTGGEYGNCIVTDASGNVYTTGAFTGTVDFDPGAATFNLTSAGGLDIFVSKLDAAGNFVWAKQLGGTSDNSGISIAVDASGNVYTTGEFQGTADFDPGAGTFNLTSAGADDIFVSKLDAAGNFAWAVRFGSTGGEAGLAIALDASANVYTTGAFRLTVDFDPGAGTANLTSAGVDDVFISKLDATGNFIYAKRLGGTSNENSYSITVDASGNVYTSGFFIGTADFDPGAATVNLTSVGLRDIFVSKLDAGGNFVYAKQSGGTTSDNGNSVAVDASGNVYLAGDFSGTADFDPGAGAFNLTSAGQADIFVSKLDASGNFVWARGMGGTGIDIASMIKLDASGNIHINGGFEVTADFDPGAGTFNLTSAGNEDVFISKLDASGNFVYAVRLGGTLGEVATSIAVDVSGNIYSTGGFEGTADFDPGAGIFNITVAGDLDVYVHKMSQNAVDPPPTVTINQAAGQADPTGASPINFTVVFNETVTGFATGDVTLSGTAGATTATVTGSGTTYNVAVSGMTANGTVIATIAAGVATDAGGNPNTASTSTDNTVTYNGIVDPPPTVTINQAAGQADPTGASPINFTVVFNETVTGFATGDVTLSGTAGATTATVTGSGTTYNVAVSGMTANGTVIATIAAGVATDAGGNPNTASTSTDNTVQYNPPVACAIICPANITVNNSGSQCGAIVNYPAPVGSGSCGVITSSPASGSFFPVGTTTVNVTSTSGATCSFTITVTGGADKIIIYPVPSDGNLKIAVCTEMAGATVKAYDITGKKLRQWIIGGGLNMYQFNWQQGIYLLEFIKGSMQEIKTIIITR